VRPDIGTMTPLGFDDDGALFYRLSNRVLDIYSAELAPDGNSFVAEPQPITDRYVGTNTGPVWSPQGDRIAFVSYRGAGARGDKHLVIRTLQTGQEQEYPFETADLRNPVSPRWAADGKSITLDARSTVDNLPGTYRLDIASGRWTQESYLRDVSGRGRRASDRQIAGLRSADARLTFGFRHADMFEGVEERLLGAFEKGFFWASPDIELWSQDADDITEDLAIVPLFRSLHIHSWDLSPDGLRLAIASAEDSTRIDSLVSKVMRIMPVEGGEAVEVFRTSGSNEIVSTRWTPNGNSLLLRVASIDDAADGAVWRVPLGSGEPVRTSLPLTERQLRELDFHPDGRHVAFSTSDSWSEVWAMEGFPWTEGQQP